MITIKQPQAPSSIMSQGKRESVVKIEEDVDILGLDTTTSYQHFPTLSRKAMRQGSAGYRESSMDVGSSRAITPNRTFSTAQKKKKKKISEAGVIFASDGSLAAVHGGKFIYSTTILFLPYSYVSCSSGPCVFGTSRQTICNTTAIFNHQQGSAAINILHQS
jgi:hypothetical protein